MRKPKFGFPTRSDTKIARSLQFWILEKEGLYYLCSENKGADQLRGYRKDRKAGLHLCFRICRLLVFSCGSPFLHVILYVTLICIVTVLVASPLIGYYKHLPSNKVSAELITGKKHVFSINEVTLILILND